VNAPARRREENLILDLHVLPGAGREEVVGMHGQRIKVRLRAAPVGGRANAALARFMAREFGVPCAQVMVLAGAHSRSKRLCIRGPQREPAWLARVDMDR